jgi:hypothetical protein
MSHLALGLIAGCVICLIHLAIGLALGARFGQSKVRYVALSRPATESSDIQRLSSQWFELCLRLSEMAGSVNELKQAPAELMSQWKVELVRLTHELCQSFEVQRRDKKDCAEPNSLAGPLLTENSGQDEVPTQEVINNTIILELLDERQLGFADSDDTTPLVRYRFSTKQPLAPAPDSRPLLAEAFSMVQFHDLSVRDVRFFLDDRPGEDNVVIGLGVPKPVKWIAAKIEDYRSVFMYGRVGYLVTARLLGSIDQRNRVASQGLVKQSTRSAHHDAVRA